MAHAKRRIATAMLCLTGLTACDKYLDRRDQITFGSGDAVAANKAAQIINPWPTSARTITHGMRGEQAEAALAKLRRRESAEDSAATPSTSQLSPVATGQPKQ